jgi:hypothetical protein
MTNPTQSSYKHNYSVPQPEYSDVLQLPRSIMKEEGNDITQGHLDESTLVELRDDLINNWDIYYSNPNYQP